MTRAKCLQNSPLQLRREHRLAESNRNGRVRESEFAIRSWYELFTWHRGERIKDRRVEYLPGADLLVDHLLARGECVHRTRDYGQYRQGMPCP